MKTRDELLREGLEIVDKVVGNNIKKYNLLNYMSSEDIEDLKQDCYIEMIKVVDERYDQARGTRLSTYLSPRIHGFIKDYFAEQSKTGTLAMNEDSNDQLGLCLELFSHMPNSQVTIDDIPDSEIKDLVFDISHSEDTYEIFDALLQLPKYRKEVIFGYYLLNKSIKEISENKGIKPSTGWVYKLKREGIQKLKEILKQKGIL